MPLRREGTKDNVCKIIKMEGFQSEIKRPVRGNEVEQLADGWVTVGYSIEVTNFDDRGFLRSFKV
jgi:hypothetical protein